MFHLIEARDGDGHGDGAVELANRALALSRQVHGDAHSKTLELTLDVASVKLGSGDMAGVRALVEPTLAALEAGDELLETGRAKFLLGQALYGLGQRKLGLAQVRAGLALLEAQDAAAVLAGQDRSVTLLIEKLVAWLRARE
ncbi:hypothetical protein DB30_07671 [Enhygromyxa salina]|uniref:Uncharacterized protein n=1 Tax=Enhygromyxa salina TaxID=215803 RepID=A0A0C2D669_9BACT|nr:hypothetical protein [Enhygromyxa salina]KIG18656.1 hypothetical protein DB30_07671 [Enhygromyxa salina]